MSDRAVPVSEPPPLVEPLYDPGRRGRWVAPVLLALAGLCAIQVIVLRSLVIPQAAAKGDVASLPALETVANVAAVGIAVFAVAGIAAGARGMRPIRPAFDTTTTMIVFALATLALMPLPVFALVMSRNAASGDAEQNHVFRYMCTLMGAGAASLALLGLLRWRRVRVAAVLTPAVALLSLFVAPFGTLAGIAWFISIRKRETSAI